MKSIAGARLVALVCAAQVLVQIGAYSWPALMPSMIGRWKLSNAEAGWITGIFYAAYLVSVPVLVTLTDRVEARLVYLFGVGCTVASHLLFGFVAEGFWSALALRAIAGIGWAGTYMTGLKLLADQVDAKLMSRAVTGHAASIGMAGALSYAFAGFLADGHGWQASFVAAGLCAATAWLIAAIFVPPHALPPPSAAGAALFDFRPVLRNRSAMAYSLAYCFHTLEMSALRGWGVAFLGFAAAGSTGTLGPALVMTVLGLLGTVASVAGNEVAIRFGRRRLITIAMLGSVLLGAALGYVGSVSYAMAVALMIAYAMMIWLDSSSLTAGTAGSAEPSRRGATLAVHSSLGYAGGFAGPLLVGIVLDAGGGMSRATWGLAFLAIAVLSLISMVVFRVMRPNELTGDARI